MEKKRRLLAISSLLLFFFNFASSQPYIGINYGTIADNLPPPSTTAQLLTSTTISKVRLYTPDPAMLQSLANTNISVVVGTANSDIPSLASSAAAASQWASSNLLPFLPSTSISAVSVGNEVLSSGDPSLPSLLLPAMQNLQSALSASAPQVKISTVHSMAVLASSDPPSSGAFHSDITPTLAGILGFLQQTGAPFMINPYPYFAYRSDPTPETLAFCLFQPNLGRLDSGSGVTYTNMFDAQVDAIRAALNAAGFPAVEIVVAETGWPYRGDADEVGATVDTARDFNGNLVAHLRSLTGTPMMPGKSVETYLFALYDEDLKPGPLSERSFGLYRPDSTPIYDAGLAKSASPPQVSSPPPGIVAVVPVPTGCSGVYTCPQQQVPAARDAANAVGSQSHDGSALNLVRRVAMAAAQRLGFRSLEGCGGEATAGCRALGILFAFLFYLVVPLLVLT